jgi:FkbM family methyltransferase
MQDNKTKVLDFLNTKWDGSWQELEKFSTLYQGKGWGGSIEDEIDCCLSLLDSDPQLIIDIGSNVGLYTQVLLTRFPKSTYFLFEPSKHNIEILSDKFYSFDNVYCSSYALSDETTVKNLYSDKEGSGLASLSKRRLDHFNIFMDVVETVETIRFDEFLECDDIPDIPEIIDYVKMDVEGHELSVLKGFGSLVDRVKLIQFEFGGCNIDTRTYFQDFWYFFKDNDFSIYVITPYDGPKLVNNYQEALEFFTTTNYIALNNKLLNK